MSRVRRPCTPSWSLCWQPSPLAAVAPYLPAPGSPVCRSRPAEDEASSLQQRFVSIVKAVCPSVVQIAAPLALGSGVVFDALGDVVTNALFVKDHKPGDVNGQGGDGFRRRLVRGVPGREPDLKPCITTGRRLVVVASDGTRCAACREAATGSAVHAATGDSARRQARAEAGCVCRAEGVKAPIRQPRPGKLRSGRPSNS